MICFECFRRVFAWTNLLHVSKDVLTTVENAFALLRVQVEDKVSGVVGITVFIPVVERTVTHFLYWYVVRIRSTVAHDMFNLDKDRQSTGPCITKIEATIETYLFI